MFKKELLGSDVLKFLYKVLPWLTPIDDAPENVVQEFIIDQDVLENKLHGTKMLAPWTFGKGLNLVSCNIRLVVGRESGVIPTVLLTVSAKDIFNILVFHKIHGRWINNPYAYCSSPEKAGCVDLLGEAEKIPPLLLEMFTAMFQAAINILEREFKITAAESRNPAFAPGNA